MKTSIEGKLWYHLGDDVWECRRPRPGEETPGRANPEKTWRRLIMREENADRSETNPKDGRVAVYGSGDQTKSVYGEDGKPHRFKEGTKAGQMSELKHLMEKRFVEKNKAAWPVKVDISY